MPPLIGFAAAHGSLTSEAWILFAILFVWQFPHFYAIAWMYKDDYAKAGIKMLPVVDSTGEQTARQILFYSLALIPISMIPRYLGMSGNFYLAGALILGRCISIPAFWWLATKHAPTPAGCCSRPSYICRCSTC